MSINLIVKMCNCHDIPYDVCIYQKRLRKFGLSAYAELLVTEKVVPEWSSSYGYGITETNR